MASGLRASRIKKNKQGLKKRVFGPVEAARNERMNAKLMALASEPKPQRPEMEVDGKDADMDAETEAKNNSADNEMEIDGTPTTKKPSNEKRRTSTGRVQKSKHRRARNEIAFAKHPMKKSSKKTRKA